MYDKSILSIWLAVLQMEEIVDLPERIPVTATTLINSLKSIIYKKILQEWD